LDARDVPYRFDPQSLANYDKDLFSEWDYNITEICSINSGEGDITDQVKKLKL